MPENRDQRALMIENQDPPVPEVAVKHRWDLIAAVEKVVHVLKVPVMAQHIQESLEMAQHKATGVGRLEAAVDQENQVPGVG